MNIWNFDSLHLSIVASNKLLKSDNVSQLAKILAKYESASRSSGVNSSEYKTEFMTTSSVSRDACKLFQCPAGDPLKQDVYRQVVVDRINDDDITPALKLCFIVHQIPFCRDNMKFDLPDLRC